MADLLPSLLVPSRSGQAQTLEHASSNESFHSTRSQSSQSEWTENERQPIFDVHTYLNDPVNVALLASAGSKRKASSPTQPRKVLATSLDRSEPVPLGTKTSHYVSTLNTLCQTKGLPTPVFDIYQTGEGSDASFGGAIRVGHTNIGCQKRWKNKKEAREGLSEEALPTVKEMAALPKEQRQVQPHVSALVEACQSKGIPTPVFEIIQTGEGNDAQFGGSVTVGDTRLDSVKQWKNKKEARAGLAEEALQQVADIPSRGRNSPGNNDKNWIGLLHQYHQAEGSDLSPEYNFYAIGPQSYSATCSLQILNGQTFGSPTTSFSSKKAAQTAAAKEAIEHLIATSLLNPDGSPVQKRRSSDPYTSLSSTLRVHHGDDKEIKVVNPSATCTQLVAEFVHLLGLPQIQYQLAPTSPHAPSLLSGHAKFAAPHYVQGLEQEIGEVRNVYGKKNAKEESARRVWEVLKGLAESRGFKVRDGFGEA